MKDYGNVLREYEQNGLDVKFKFYQRDCHSVITAEDLDSVQFHNGHTFSENGSELAFEVMKEVRQIEDFIKLNPENELCKRYVESYQDVCKSGYSKAEKAAEALSKLEDVIQQEVETKRVEDKEVNGKSEEDFEKIKFFHDQKTDKFFEDMQTGRYNIGIYNITERQIGVATINESTEIKDEAKEKVIRDEPKRGQIEVE